MTDSARLVTRRVVASLGSLGIAVVLVARFVAVRAEANADFEARDLLLVGLLMAAPAIAAGLVWTRRLGLQLLARGAWWSLLLAGGLLATLSATSAGGAFGMCIVAGAAIALLAAGTAGLGVSARFAPVAFRSTLTLALILAMADTCAFTWIGLGNAMYDDRYTMLAVVPVMLVGVAGLLRLRTWGLIVSVATNGLVVVLAAADVFAIGAVRWLFVATAALQLLVPLPMIVTLVRGRTPDPDAWRRTRTLLPVAVIVAIVAVSVIRVLGHRDFVAG